MNEDFAEQAGWARSNRDGHKSREGYHVQYANKDGSTYHSWSPKDVFEDAYRKAETEEDRIKIELEELQRRTTLLYSKLMNTERGFLGEVVNRLMQTQYFIMRSYDEVLTTRLDEIRKEAKK